MLSQSFKNLDQYAEKLFFHPFDLSRPEKVQIYCSIYRTAWNPRFVD